MSVGNGRTDWRTPPSLTSSVDLARLVEAIRQAPGVERKALRIEEAAESLGVSVDFFNAHIAPDLRIVREGRIKLIPATELDRWLDENAARAFE